MHTTANAHAVMHYFEQLKLRAYPDPYSPLFTALKRAGVNPYELATVPAEFAHLSGAPWTIGWGDTGPDVVPGLVITAAEADGRFAKRLAREFEPGVLDVVQQNPTAAQFDAMVCLAYNIGVGAFRGSTLLRKYNLGDFPGAAEEFLKWNKSGGKVSLGLRRRRAAERALFLGATGAEAVAIGAAVV